MAGRGRPRPKQKPVEDDEDTSQNSTSTEDPKDQDFVPSPTLSRCLRNSREFFAQATMLPFTSRSPVRNVMRATRRSSRLNPEVRVLNEKHEEPNSRNGDNPLPEMQHFTSKQPCEEPIVSIEIGDSLPIKKNNTITNVDKSVSAGSPDWCAPTTEHLDDFIFEELNTQRGAQQAAASYQAPLETHRPLKENVALHHESRLEKSIDVTGFAKQLDDMDDDPEEVDFALDPSIDFVFGHRVKAEIGPLLRRIFAKYGDITRDTNLESSESLSHFLNCICRVYEKLEQTTFFKAKHVNLDKMLTDVRDPCERVKLNVGWLRAKIEYVSQTLTGYQEYMGLKERQGTCDVAVWTLEEKLNLYKSQLSDIQHKVCATENELAAKKGRGGSD